MSLDEQALQGNPELRAVLERCEVAEARMTAGAEWLEREARHMRRGRLLIGWAALLLSAAAFATVFTANGFTQTVLAVIQTTLWTFIAALNLSGPRFFDRLFRRRRE